MQKNKYVTVDNPQIPVIGATVTDDDPCDFSTFFEGTPQECVGSVRVTDMYRSNFSMREYKGDFDRPTFFVNERGLSSENHVGVCLFIKGEVRSFLKGTSIVQNSSFDYSQNYKYDPSNECVHFIDANTSLHLAHFAVRTEFFKELLPQEQGWADMLRNIVEKRQRFIGREFQPIQAAQLSALRNIYDCPLTGKLGHLMVETSVTQIILLQMYSLFGRELDGTSKADNRDVDLAYAVRDYLTRNFLDDHSLEGLSREFGTNRTKLMTVFRQQFSKSIFDYLSEERMNYARELLCEGDKTVAEIARLLRYKNANHFSTAFKKKFSICPSEVKT
jgi:AraC-like DNA-binding protein